VAPSDSLRVLICDTQRTSTHAARACLHVLRRFAKARHRGEKEHLFSQSMHVENAKKEQLASVRTAGVSHHDILSTRNFWARLKHEGILRRYALK
jgi:hypothetical protein